MRRAARRCVADHRSVPHRHHRRPHGKLIAACEAFYRKEDDPQAVGNPFLAGIAAQQREQEIEVWPENWQSFTLFLRLQTQWSVGMAGPTGLRYEALYPLLDRAAAGDAACWDGLLDDIQVLERTALAAMNRKD